MQLTEWLDGYQRRHRWVGFPLAVVYKFFDDQGTYLAALITYYGFLSLFPLLLLLTSVLGFVLQGDPDLQQRILDSTLSQFPIIGDQLGDPQGLQGSGAAVVVGGLVAAVRRPRRRPGAAERDECRLGGPPQPPAQPHQAHVCAACCSSGPAGIAVLATTVLSALGSSAAAVRAPSSAWPVAVLVTVVAVVLNAAVFVVAFRIATASKLRVRDVAARAPSSPPSSGSCCSSSGRRTSATSSRTPAPPTACSPSCSACSPGSSWRPSASCSASRSTSCAPSASTRARC